MDMLASLNAAVDYIENNLDRDIDFAMVARAACSSQSHFQRMFAFVTGIPLSEYIRRRRLTLAALELQNGPARVLDVAVKYGYNSADSFSRAFQGLHGIVPSKARGIGARLKAYPRIAFTLSIKGVVAMNYRMEIMEGFKIVGVKEFTTTVNGENSKQIPKMWSTLPKETFEELMGLSNLRPDGVLGVCADMYNDGFDYWIAVATDKPCPGHLSELEIPAATWAVFEATGPMPGAIQEMFPRIYSEWFPTSGYEHAPAPEIEWYSDGDMQSESYKSEVWIPVIKK